MADFFCVESTVLEMRRPENYSPHLNCFVLEALKKSFS